MAKVYTGQVVVPVEKLDDYLKMLKQAEEERAPFRDHLTSLLDDFHHHLDEKFSQPTARKHTGVIQLFIEFLCGYTDVQDISEITGGMVNTHFEKWWKRKVWDSSSPNDRRVALKKFFQFLAREKGIVNENVLKALGAGKR